MTDTEHCRRLRELDARFETDKDSPLHHDNRHCPIHRQGN
jgi:hypothetical protein